MDNVSVKPLSGGKLSYVFILVRDFEEMLRFYRDMLGLDVYYLEESRCAFMRAAPEGPAIAIYAGRESPISDDAHWLLAFDVADLEPAVTALKARGVQMEDVEGMAFGRYAKFRDPEGNRLEVHESSTEDA